jgi:tetratricopeptide (TPR) repeat protein
LLAGNGQRYGAVMRAVILALLLAAAPAVAQTPGDALQRCLDGPGGPTSGLPAARAACDDVLHDAALPAGRRAEALSARASIRLHQRDDRGAIADIDTAVGLAPDQPDHRFERARILEAMENLPGAIAELTETLRLFPSVAAEAFRYRAVLREEAGDLVGALADYGAALEAGQAAGEPPDHSLLVERAKLRLRLGDAPGALADLLAAASMQVPTERLIALCTTRARLGAFDAARAECAAAHTGAQSFHHLQLAAAAVAVELLAGDRAAARRLIAEARQRGPSVPMLTELARAADAPPGSPVVGATPFTKRWFEILFGPGARLP